MHTAPAAPATGGYGVPLTADLRSAAASCQQLARVATLLSPDEGRRSRYSEMIIENVKIDNILFIITFTTKIIIELCHLSRHILCLSMIDILHLRLRCSDHYGAVVQL